MLRLKWRPVEHSVSMLVHLQAHNIYQSTEHTPDPPASTQAIIPEPVCSGAQNLLSPVRALAFTFIWAEMCGLVNKVKI